MKPIPLHRKVLYGAILVLPMVFLFNSVASSGWNSASCGNQRWACELLEFVAVFGTGVGSVFTCIYVMSKLEFRKK